VIRSFAIELLVVAGFVALALVGGPLPAIALFAVVLGWLGAVLPARLRQRVPWVPLAVGSVVGIAGQLGLGAEPGQALGSLLAVLQVHRRVARRGDDDDRVAVVLAGLMVVAAAGTGPQPGFLPVAVVYGLCLPLGLLPSGVAAGWGWLPVHLGLAAVVFIALPRPVRPANELAPSRLTGFAPDVQLGDLDPLLDDPTVVLRARVGPGEPLPDPIYWRGLALDAFDGTNWYSRTPANPAMVSGGSGTEVEIELASDADGGLFVPGRLVDVDVDDVRSDSQGGWFVEPRGEPLTYAVTVMPAGDGVAWFREPASDPRRWLDLPQLHSDVFRLADEVAGEGSPREQIERLAAWLSAEVTYTRAGRPEGSGRPLEAFLLRERRGHCELVAASLAVMGRAVGIPTRVVNGFLGAEQNTVTGEIVVRRHHAHSWTEVLLDGQWVVFDATPDRPAPAARGWQTTLRSWADAAQHWFERDLLGFDRRAQQRAVVQAAATIEAWVPVPSPGQVPWVGLGALVALLLVCAVALRVVVRWGLRRVSEPTEGVHGAVARQHARARSALAGAGLAPDEALPPVAAAESVRDAVPEDVGDALLALAWLHYEVALAGADASANAARARDLCRVVVQGLDARGTE